MEPTEPIRGGQQSELPTDRRFLGSLKSIVFRVADLVMCWLALCGLVNAAAGVAAFPVEKMNLQLLGQPLTTPLQKLGWIAIYFAISAVGFTYMLWRYHWRYRLSTLFKIMVFLCIALAALTTNVVFAVIAIGPLVFVYVVVWACRPKGLPE